MPPELPQEDSPLDRATGALLAKKYDECLAWAGGVLRRNLSSPSGLYLVGRAFAGLDRKAEADDALALAVEAAIDAGVLGVGIAAAQERRRLGGDAAGSIAALARAFAKGSGRLREGTPPKPPGAMTGVTALTSRGEALHAEVDVLVETSRSSPRASTTIAPVSPFSSLGEAALAKLLERLEPMDVPRDTVVVEEGSPGEDAFVVVRGRLAVRRDEQRLTLAHLSAGALFGEMALLARAPRAATVAAVVPTIVLRAPKDALDEVGEEVPEVAHELAAHCLRRMVENLERTSPVLAAVPASERSSLVSSLETRVYERGDALIVEGQGAEGLFLIASGEVAVMKREPGASEALVLAALGPGDTAGEVALVLRRAATADVVATHPTVALFLSKTAFLELIQEHPLVIARLYALAVQRDDENLRLLSDEVLSADDVVLV